MSAWSQNLHFMIYKRIKVRSLTVRCITISEALVFWPFFFATQKCPAYIIQSWKRSLRKHFLDRIWFFTVKIEVHGRVLIDFWRCSKRTFRPNQAKFYSVSPIFRLYVLIFWLYVDFSYFETWKGFPVTCSNRTFEANLIFCKILVKFRLFEWFLTGFRPHTGHFKPIFELSKNIYPKADSELASADCQLIVYLFSAGLVTSKARLVQIRSIM